MNKLHPDSVSLKGIALLVFCLLFTSWVQAATPAPPTGLAASAPSGRVVLSWTASSGATSYNVKRTMSSGGPYYQLANVASNSFTDYGVLNGNTYYYVVSAVNADGESSDTSQVSGTPGASATPPGAPTGLAATAGNAQVNLAWAAGSGATSYLVKRSTSSGGPYAQIAAPGSTSYTDSAVTNGTAYYYVVSSVNAAGESANSPQATATPAGSGSGSGSGASGIPATPTGLTAASGNGRVGLTWTASSGATSYNVKRTMTSGGPYYQLARVNSTSFNDHGVLNGSTYYYVVSATNSNGESSNTSQVAGTPGATSATVPAAPGGLSASASNARVSLTWSASSGATSYRVKRSTSSGGPYTQIAAPGSTSYTDSAVANGTTYYYVVSAVNSAGESGNSGQAVATPSAPVTVPAAPTGLSATGGNAQVNLGWPASSGATSYRVKRATSSGGPYTQIGAPTSTSHTDTAVSNGTAYYYVVTAVNSAGESGNSPQATATPVASTGIPATPGMLMAVSSNGRVTLNWGASSGATSYNVKRTMTSGGPYYPLANVSTTTFADHGVLNNNTYYYVVSAVNSAGESANTSQVSGTPGASATIPVAPTSLSASAGNAQVSLSWPASSGATGYRVKRATTSGGPYTQVAAPTSTSHIDTSLTNGTRYYYVVTATNSAGESGNSPQASAAPAAGTTVPAAPTGLSASPSSGRVTLSWTASSGATSYRVKRSTTSSGPYTQIASPTSTSHADTAVSNGTTYYYVVTAVNAAGESGNSAPASATPASNVTLLFDDFDGTSIDTAKWTVVNRLSDQVNGELDCVLARNVSVRNGFLEGVSKYEDYTCGDSIEAPKLMHYTSWHIQQKTTPFLYGTIEARVRVPGGTGLWPLVWMLGHEWQASQPYTANTPEHQWPNGGWGEIDIVEFMGGQRRENNTVVHFNQPGGAWNSTLPYDANTRFMVYRLQWSASALIWSVDAEDGQGFRTLRTITDPARIPNVPMYVILSTAIGGIGGGTPNPATFPQTYQADWVRVTQ